MVRIDFGSEDSLLAVRRQACAIDGLPYADCGGKVHPCWSCQARGRWKLCGVHFGLDWCQCVPPTQLRFVVCTRCRGHRGVIECVRCIGRSKDDDICENCDGCGTEPHLLEARMTG